MRKNKKIAGVAGLAAIMVIGGTFAYFNQTMTVTNPFDTGKYDTNVTEDFKPEDGNNWEPGAEVNKDVTVKNTGDYDVLVRVKLTEKWVNKTTSNTVAENTTGLKGDASQVDAKDGLTKGDYSVVEKTLNGNDWVYNDADGYWYYKTNLKAKTDTGKFLDAVKLMENADMGKYTVKNYYTVSETRPTENDISENDPSSHWVEYEGTMPEGTTHTLAVTTLDQNASGYANSDYTLTITAQTVQATDAAMKDAFGLTAQPTGCNWNLTQNK